MKTKAFIEEYKGLLVFAIWEVDECGDKVGAYPLLSMGTKKAKALAKHLDQLQQFVMGATCTGELKL